MPGCFLNLALTYLTVSKSIRIMYYWRGIFDTVCDFKWCVCEFFVASKWAESELISISNIYLPLKFFTNTPFFVLSVNSYQKNIARQHLGCLWWICVVPWTAYARRKFSPQRQEDVATTWQRSMAWWRAEGPQPKVQHAPTNMKCCSKYYLKERATFGTGRVPCCFCLRWRGAGSAQIPIQLKQSNQ